MNSHAACYTQHLPLLLRVDQKAFTMFNGLIDFVSHPLNAERSKCFVLETSRVLCCASLDASRLWHKKVYMRRIHFRMPPSADA